MTLKQLIEIEELNQHLFKRVIQWWTAELAAVGQDGDTYLDATKAAERAKAEADDTFKKIDKLLTSVMGPITAGFVRRSRAFEPYRDKISECQNGNLINEMWHRVDRLTSVLREAQDHIHMHPVDTLP